MVRRKPALLEVVARQVGDPPGNHDRVLDFSTPITGVVFFVPTQDFLDDLPHPPAAG